MTITSKSNELLVHVRKLQGSGSYRREHGEFVGEGLKLLNEAIAWQVDITHILVTEGSEGLIKPDVNFISVSEAAMKSVSQLTTPSPVLFTAKIPKERNKSSLRGAVVLDGIQDPGNMGTIIRTANALGIDSLILCNGCVDPYNPKVVRSTMGALFRQRLYDLTCDELISLARSQGVTLGATALSESSVDIRSRSLSDMAVIIGSEGSGVSRELLCAADIHLIIPMKKGTESMNAAVAASIIMWEMSGKNI